MKKKNISLTISVVAVIISAGTFFYTKLNNEKLQRPYLEIRSVNFTFYDSNEKQINDILSDKIVSYKTSFEIINHGVLPALISNDINGLFHSYNKEWGGMGVGVSPYEGTRVTIFQGEPRIIETYVNDVSLMNDNWTKLVKYFKDQEKEKIPAKLEINIHYAKPLDYEEIYNKGNKSYFVSSGKGYKYYGVFHCDIFKAGINCKPLLVTPGNKKTKW